MSEGKISDIKSVISNLIMGLGDRRAIKTTGTTVKASRNMAKASNGMVALDEDKDLDQMILHELGN